MTVLQSTDVSVTQSGTRISLSQELAKLSRIGAYPSAENGLPRHQVDTELFPVCARAAIETNAPSLTLAFSGSLHEDATTMSALSEDLTLTQEKNIDNGLYEVTYSGSDLPAFIERVLNAKQKPLSCLAGQIERPVVNRSMAKALTGVLQNHNLG